MKTIFINQDDEITELIEKLKGSAESEVLIVLPEAALISGSLVNFKILKKNADELGKKVVVVSSDRQARFFAKEALLSAREAVEEKIVNPIEAPKIEPVPLPPKVSSAPPSDLSAQKPKQLSSNHVEFRLPYIKFDKKTFLGAGILVVIGIAVLLYILVPSAKVLIYPKTEYRVTASEITIQDGLDKAIPETGLIGGTLTEYKLEKRSEFAATGGVVAKGGVKFTGNGPGATTFPQGTTIKNSSTGKEYTSDTGFTVPIAPGTTTVAVSAKQPGLESNVPDTATSEFKIEGYTFSGKSTGITGGEKKTVSQDDMNKAVETLSKTALPEAEAELKKKLPQGRLVESTVKKDITSRSVPEVNAVAENAKFEVFLTVTISAMVFNEDDVVTVIKEKAKKELAESQTIYETDKTKIIYASIKGGELAGGKVKINATLPVLIGGSIDEALLISKLAGKGGDEVNKILTANESIAKYEITNKPSWLRSMPYLKSRIKIELKILPPDKEE